MVTPVRGALNDGLPRRAAPRRGGRGNLRGRRRGALAPGVGPVRPDQASRGLLTGGCFRMEEKGGRVVTFGDCNDPGAVSMLPGWRLGTPWSWTVERVADRRGNEMKYEYVVEDGTASFSKRSATPALPECSETAGSSSNTSPGRTSRLATTITAQFDRCAGSGRSRRMSRARWPGATSLSTRQARQLGGCFSKGSGCAPRRPAATATPCRRRSSATRAPPPRSRGSGSPPPIRCASTSSSCPTSTATGPGTWCGRPGSTAGEAATPPGVLELSGGARVSALPTGFSGSWFDDERNIDLDGDGRNDVFGTLGGTLAIRHLHPRDAALRGPLLQPRRAAGDPGDQGRRLRRRRADGRAPGESGFTQNPNRYELVIHFQCAPSANGQLQFCRRRQPGRAGRRLRRLREDLRGRGLRRQRLPRPPHRSGSHPARRGRRGHLRGAAEATTWSSCVQSGVGGVVSPGRRPLRPGRAGEQHRP